MPAVIHISIKIPGGTLFGELDGTADQTQEIIDHLDGEKVWLGIESLPGSSDWISLQGYNVTSKMNWDDGFPNPSRRNTTIVKLLESNVMRTGSGDVKALSSVCNMLLGT